MLYSRSVQWEWENYIHTPQHACFSQHRVEWYKRGHTAWNTFTRGFKTGKTNTCLEKSGQFFFARFSLEGGLRKLSGVLECSGFWSGCWLHGCVPFVKKHQAGRLWSVRETDTVHAQNKISRRAILSRFSLFSIIFGEADASNQPLYINQILHKPFEKRSKNVLSYWYYITMIKHQECAESFSEQT